MKAIFSLLGYGFLIWLVPFAVGMMLFPLISVESALFDTLMSITLTSSAALFSFLSLRNKPNEKRRLNQLIALGLFWLALALCLDAPMFLLSDMTGMSPAEYAADIGLSYVIIPVVVIAIGLAFNQSDEP